MEFGSVSVRFRHPTRSLAFLSDVLGLEAGRTWVAGAPRQTPVSTPLGGVYESSYWYSSLRFEPGNGFTPSLRRAIEILKHADSTIRELQTTGGSVQLYVVLAGWINNGDDITPDLLRTMADLGITLQVEVFPD